MNNLLALSPGPRSAAQDQQPAERQSVDRKRAGERDLPVRGRVAPPASPLVGLGLAMGQTPAEPAAQRDAERVAVSGGRGVLAPADRAAEVGDAPLPVVVGVADLGLEALRRLVARAAFRKETAA
jgi:hypothetical protein